MKISSPEKIFIPAPPETNCACNDCPYMKLNTLEKLYLCMEYETPEIKMSEELLRKEQPIERCWKSVVVRVMSYEISFIGQLTDL